MYTITIDTKAIQNEIESLKQINIEMNNLFERVNNRLSTINDFWSGTAAEQTINEYKILSDKYSSIINKNSEFITFLEKKVKESHENMEKNIDNNINSNIAIK